MTEMTPEEILAWQQNYPASWALHRDMTARLAPKIEDLIRRAIKTGTTVDDAMFNKLVISLTDEVQSRPILASAILGSEQT